MVTVAPESPVFANTSERVVWECLRDSLGPDDVLIANLRLTDEAKDYEADLVVLMPDHGVLVLEVKGGSVWHDEAGWWVRRTGQPVKVDPVDQARAAKYAVRAYVERDPRWKRRRVAWAHGVVTPYAEFPPEFEVPDLPRWALHDKLDLPHLADRVREHAWGLQQGMRPPRQDDVSAITEILAGRMHTVYDVVADSDERASTADRLTHEQATILDVTRLLRRVEVRGGAGSGKTVLALQQAKQLTRGRGDRPAQKVALLCYSLGLAEYLKRQVASWHRKDQPAFVGTFHEFGIQWGAPAEGSRDDAEFWELSLPRRMDELAGALGVKDKYDAIIVDEAQDFADLWWRPVLKALRDEDESGLYIYSDEHQRLFARFGRPPVQLIPLVLDHNLRNTKQIHESFGSLAPSRMYSRGGDGADVRFVAASPENAISAADDEVDRLLDEGWRPEHICLLTTGNRHPIQLERTEFHGQEGYWETFWDEDQVFYGHVLGCKGLERRAVVLCINETTIRDRARERLYVGMSRATDVLIVVGEPTTIREVGGADVARRLGI
jgi:hypothetical protein